MGKNTVTLMGEKVAQKYQLNIQISMTHHYNIESIAFDL